MEKGAKRLAESRLPHTPTGVKSWHAWVIAAAAWGALGGSAGRVAAADLVLTRPGQIAVSALTGEAFLTEAGKRRPAKVEERVRVDTTVATGRRSLVSLAFSNGAVLELGPDSELEVEELLQAPYSSYPKPETLKEEPSLSQTRVRLVRGDLRLTVKPLKVERGSTFTVVLPAGQARVAEGAFYALASMTEARLGMCAVELSRGAAEFELPGAAPAKIPVGRRLAFAVEVDRITGAVKVGEMPAAPAKTGK